MLSTFEVITSIIVLCHSEDGCEKGRIPYIWWPHDRIRVLNTYNIEKRWQNHKPSENSLQFY